MTLGIFTICQQSRSFFIWDLTSFCTERFLFIEETLEKQIARKDSPVWYLIIEVAKYFQKFSKFSKMFSAMSLICNGVVWFSTIIILIFETIIVIFKIIILIFETIIVIFKIIIVIFETIIVIFKTIMIVADINIEIEISSTSSQIKILRNSVGRFAMMVMMILINILCNGVGCFAATRRDGLQCLGWAAPPTRSSMFSSSWL